MKRVIAAGAFALLVASTAPTIASDVRARDVLGQKTNTIAVEFAPDAEATIPCPTGLITDVTLEGGEVIKEGSAAPKNPFAAKHVYSGGDSNGGASSEKKITPHLIFAAPEKVGSFTNVIVTTNRRTYHLFLIAVADKVPMRYRFTYNNVFISRAAPAAKGVRLAHPLESASDGSPVAVADPAAACFDYAYTIARTPLPNDHPAKARLSSAPFPVEWTPRTVCTEGRHTFITFARTDVTPNDAPIPMILGPEGDALCNYSYDDALRRLTIDGVPDALVLIMGSQQEPMRLAVRRAAHNDLPIGATAK